jgi:hypothetical protein
VCASLARFGSSQRFPKTCVMHESPSVFIFVRGEPPALAEAAVNVEHAMHLTAHSDPRIHVRYVRNTSAMRLIPDAAIPRVHAPAPSELPSRDDSRPRPNDSQPAHTADAAANVEP